MPNLEPFKNIRVVDTLVRAELRRIECQPRILVVADGLDFNAGNHFGLTEFVTALRASTVHGMKPLVTTAFHGNNASSGADITSFDFVTGLQQTYDVMFIFGIGSTRKGDPGTENNISQAELDAIAAFMQAGKGVFATGDHEALGARMSGNIPRVRQMRLWFNEDGAPPATTPERITTNSPGTGGVFEFDDQSDEIPQKIYPRYYQTAPDVSHPHALLQAPSGPIEVAPDHPHEGEIVVPPALVSPVKIGSLTIDEWPTVAGVQPAPEIIAFGMTYGGAFPGKDAVLDPRAFGVVGAWDGHLASVGRVAVDSTWHHFVNINIDGTNSGREALKPGGVPSAALQLLYVYWQNLASWLMPAKVRRCLILPRITDYLLRYPLFEELPPLRWPPEPGPGPDPDPFEHIGARVIAVLRQQLPPAEAATMIDDLRALAIGHDVPPGVEWVDAVAVGALATWIRQDDHDPAAIVARARDSHALLEKAGRELGAHVRKAIKVRHDRLVRRREMLTHLLDHLESF
jgi:hypothetical protein